jgi:hypothetical protein
LPAFQNQYPSHARFSLSPARKLGPNIIRNVPAARSVFLSRTRTGFSGWTGRRMFYSRIIPVKTYRFGTTFLPGFWLPARKCYRPTSLWRTRPDNVFSRTLQSNKFSHD